MPVIDHDTLTSLAEIGITIVGIAGLVAVFLARGTLHPMDRIRFILIVLPAGLVPITAYVPMWLARHLEDPISVWKYSSGAALAGVFAVNIIILMNGYGPRSKAFRQLSLVAHPVAIWLGLAIVPINLVLLIINTLSWPFIANQTTFELFLMFALLQAIVQFASMVLFRPSSV